MVLVNYIFDAEVIAVENHVKASNKDELLPIEERHIQTLQGLIPAKAFSEFKLLFGDYMNGMTSFEYAMVCLKYKSDKKTLKLRERIALLFVEKYPPNTIAAIRWGKNNTSLHLASFLGLPTIVSLILEKLPMLAKQKNDLEYTPLDVSGDELTRTMFRELSGANNTSLKKRVSVRQGPLRTKTTSFEDLMGNSAELNKKLETTVVVQEIKSIPNGSQSSNSSPNIISNICGKEGISKDKKGYDKPVSANPFVLADKKVGKQTMERQIIEKIQKDEEKANWKHKRSLPDLWQRKVKEAEEQRMKEEAEEAERKRLEIKNIEKDVCQSSQQECINSPNAVNQNTNHKNTVEENDNVSTQNLIKRTDSSQSSSFERKSNNVSWKERRSLNYIFGTNDISSPTLPLSQEALSTDEKQKNTEEQQNSSSSLMLPALKTSLSIPSFNGILTKPTVEEQQKEENTVFFSQGLTRPSPYSTDQSHDQINNEIVEEPKKDSLDLNKFLRNFSIPSMEDITLKMPSLEFESLMPDSDDWLNEILPPLSTQSDFNNTESSFEIEKLKEENLTTTHIVANNTQASSFENKKQQEKISSKKITSSNSLIPETRMVAVDSKMDVHKEISLNSIKPFKTSSKSSIAVQFSSTEKTIDSTPSTTDVSSKEQNQVEQQQKVNIRKELPKPVSTPIFKNTKNKTVQFDNAWSGNLEKRIYIDLKSPVQSNYFQNNIGMVLLQFESFKLAAQRLLPLEFAHADCLVSFEWQMGENKSKSHNFTVQTAEEQLKKVNIEESLAVPFETPIILHMILKAQKNEDVKKKKLAKTASNLKTKIFGSIGRRKSLLHSFSTFSVQDDEMNGYGGRHQSMMTMNTGDQNTFEFDCTVFVPIQDLMEIAQMGRVKTFSNSLTFRNVDPHRPVQNVNAHLNWHAAFIPHLNGVEDVFLPKTLSECTQSWQNRIDYPPVQMQGELIQTGGDSVKTPIKRFFKLYGQYLTSSSAKNPVNIDISMISSIQISGVYIDFEELDEPEDTQIALSRFLNQSVLSNNMSSAQNKSMMSATTSSSFILTFKDDEDIYFDVSNHSKLCDWVSAITEVKRRLMMGLVDPWLDALDNHLTRIQV